MERLLPVQSRIHWRGMLLHTQQKNEMYLPAHGSIVHAPHQFPHKIVADIAKQYANCLDFFRTIPNHTIFPL
jgi:hypothetical protein